ncbi:hypothetical protein [Ornithinimicrobium ciconiae]|uniref:hypothetical protein n=1 Tax=Ornithinimicrobium ciconiae TaxID=2594265 RepID=UPI0013FD04F0|nr:hypothetical protein [Ornithinimicrobium ciconiae]
MRTQTGSRAGQRRGTRRLAMGALPITALVLMTACGTEEEPEVADPGGTVEDTATDAAPSTSAPAATSDPVETTQEPTVAPPAPTTDEPSTEPTSTEQPSEEPTSDSPEEGAGDAMTFAEQYVDAVASGDTEAAYGMLSPEALVYYPDVSVFEDNGIGELSADLADASGEPQWAIRSAYEETHDSAQVVSLWGEGGDGEPFAHSFAVRKLDGMSWVVDQDIAPSTGEPRLNWLNPGIQEGVEWWEVNPDSPISFALLKSSGPNVAVTASIDDGDEVSQQLTERPTGGAVMFDLSESALSDGLHVVTASWVAEDDPFVHTSSTPAMTP